MEKVTDNINAVGGQKKYQ